MGAGTTVLVVDDDRDTCELYSLVLSTLAGCRVLAAGTVTDAMRLATGERPRVVLTDWLLPDGRGYELSRRLRTLPRMRKTPIIAVTGVMMTAALRREAAGAGIQTILEKPVMPERLAETVQRAIDDRRARELRAAAARMCRALAVVVRSRNCAAEDARVVRDEAVTLAARAASRNRHDIAIMVADDRGQYVAANPTASAMTGYAPDDLLGLSVWDLTPAPKADLGRDLWSEFIANGCQEGRYLLRRRDGDSVEAQYCAVANVAPGLHLSALMETTSRSLSRPFESASEHVSAGPAGG